MSINDNFFQFQSLRYQYQMRNDQLAEFQQLPPMYISLISCHDSPVCRPLEFGKTNCGCLPMFLILLSWLLIKLLMTMIKLDFKYYCSKNYTNMNALNHSRLMACQGSVLGHTISQIITRTSSTMELMF